MKLQRTYGWVLASTLMVVQGIALGQSPPTLRSELGKTVAPKTTGPHGGSLRQSGDVQVETVVDRTGIKLFLYDQKGQPTSVAKGRGAALVKMQGRAKRYRYDLLPDGNGALTARANLSRLAGRQLQIDVQVVGIAASNNRLSFREITNIPANPSPIAAAFPPQRLAITVTSATDADAALVQRQATCPVMDEPLGSMGNPIKVTVGDKPIFLCCKGCIKKVQAEPQKYLAMVHGTDCDQTTAVGAVPPGTDQVREGVYKVSAADAPFIAAQKTCPVMEEPLDAMGGPYKVEANGKAIYICCPGCAKRIAAEPQYYLGILSEQGVDAPLLR